MSGTDPKAITTTTAEATQDKEAGGGAAPAFEFTVESVKALLQEHVFRPKGPLAQARMPSSEQLAELADDLRSAQNLFRSGSGVIAEYNATYERLASAIKELERAFGCAVDVCGRLQVELHRGLAERYYNNDTNIPEKFHKLGSLQTTQERAINSATFQRELIKVIFEVIDEMKNSCTLPDGPMHMHAELCGG